MYLIQTNHAGDRHLFVCPSCKTPQLHALDPWCPWCAGDINGVERHYVYLPEPYVSGEIIMEQAVVLSETEKAKFIKTEVAAAKRRGICAPIVPHALYWDYPASVSEQHGVLYRMAYMDGFDDPVFKLETGICGRLFVMPVMFAKWVERWVCTEVQTSTARVWDAWLEVPLEMYFDTRMSSTPFGVWNLSDNALMRHCLALDVSEQLPGHLPILGFEWGALRALPKEYTSTLCFNGGYTTSNLCEMTWGATGIAFYFISPLVDLKQQRREKAEAIRRQYADD